MQLLIDVGGCPHNVENIERVWCESKHDGGHLILESREHPMPSTHMLEQCPSAGRRMRMDILGGFPTHIWWDGDNPGEPGRWVTWEEGYHILYEPAKGIFQDLDLTGY